MVHEDAFRHCYPDCPRCLAHLNSAYCYCVGTCCLIMIDFVILKTIILGQ